MSELALWPFALDRYGRPGVEATMLMLQDAHGQCVPFLIWALWLAQSGRPIGDETLAQGAELARAWLDTAVEPLRELRRRLKTPDPAMASAPRERLRLGVKSLELDAERMLLEMLEQASPAPAGAASPAALVLAAAVSAWGGAAPAALLADLAARAG